LKNDRDQDVRILLSLGNFSAVDNRGRRLPVTYADTSSGSVSPIWARSVRLKPDETLQRVEEGRSRYIFFPVDPSDRSLTEVVVTFSVSGGTPARWRIPVTR
jgi:hypothetical protein